MEEKAVQEIKIILRELILEIAELKNKVSALERELYELPPDPENKLKYIELQAENYDHIGKIYLDGYHICWPSFGQGREEECLFCIALLGKD